MITAALILAALAAAVHVFIFYLESVVWTGPRARAVFNTTESEAQATKGLAFNQGFYNLFLAVAVLAGVALMVAGHTVAGATSVFVGAGSMAAAALVLALSDRAYANAALKQGALPALAVMLLAFGLAV